MPYSVKTKLARKGREGDTLIGHLSPGDVVISRERQQRDPEFRAKLREIMGDDLERFTAGSAWNSKNPSTGLPEFMDPDGGGGAGDAGAAGGDAAGGAGPSGSGLSGGDVTGGTGVAGDTAAHAAEVSGSLAGDPSTAGGLAASDNQSSTLGDIFAGALSSIGVNTSKGVPGINTGVNTNAVGTAASAAPGAAGLVGTAASAAGLTNEIGEAIGLEAPERGIVGTLADIARGTTPDNAADFFGGQGLTGGTPGATGGRQGTEGGAQTPWQQIFASLPMTNTAPPPQPGGPFVTNNAQQALTGANSGALSLEAARALEA